MLAQQNEYLQEAVSSVAILTEDKRIRQQCQVRKEFEYWERMRENKHKRELAERDKELDIIIKHIILIFRLFIPSHSNVS